MYNPRLMKHVPIQIAAVAIAAIAVLPTCKKKSEPSQSRTRGNIQLQALPYLSSIEDSDQREGVVLHDEKRASPGLNLVTSAVRGETYLVDMDGSVLHTWRHKYASSATVDADGNLLCVRGVHGLLALDWDSKELWSVKASAHHEVVRTAAGDVWTITRGNQNVNHQGKDVVILDDFLARKAPGGESLEQISVHEFLGDRIPAERFERILATVDESAPEGGRRLRTRTARDPAHDVFHTNAITPIEREVPGVASPGDLLISVREIDFVGIVRPSTKKIVWEFEGELDRQHHPTLLDNDHILIFDNGTRRGYSRVIEVDPRTQEVVWEYSGKPEKSLFSERQGAAQRLANGNTLVTVSYDGRAIEITSDGEIVWDYLMYRRTADTREPIYRMIRIHGDIERALRTRAGSAAPQEPAANDAP